MTAFKTVMRDFCPPIFVRVVCRVLGIGILFEGDYTSWNEASAQCAGYDADEILAKVLTATVRVKEGKAAFERDSVTFDQIEYAWPVLSGLMWAAARSGGRLNVLDLGGALGSGFFQSRRFLKSLQNIRWNVVEQDHYVDAGRKYIQDGELRFYKSVEECTAENQPNVILLSSVMQYLEAPLEEFNKLNKIGAICLIIDRTPFSLSERDKLVIQKVPASIYEASYPMWIFSMNKFEKLLSENWSVVATILSPEGNVRTKKGFEFSFRGMLLESRQ